MENSDVLLHESTQLHENIQRCMTEISSIVTLALPALTGATAVVSEGKWVEDEDLYPLFAFLASLLVVMFNNVWIQLTGFTRYKYAVLLPALYGATGRKGYNFGQYAIKDGIARAMFGAAVIHLLLWPMTAVALYKAVPPDDLSIFTIPACISAVMALVTTIAGWVVASDGVKVLKQVPIA